MRREYHFWVYMLRCSDGSYYIGVTNNVEGRFWQHEQGINPGCYTFKRRPVKLVYSSYFEDIHEAISWEKVIKRWSRKKKEALIREDWEGLQNAAVCINDSHCQYVLIDVMKKITRRRLMKNFNRSSMSP